MVYYYYLLLFLLLPLSLTYSQTHVDTALSYVGVVEKTGKNDGYQVEKFLKSVGRKKGDSWCAAFVSYCLEVNKVKEPSIRSGLAQAFRKAKTVYKANNTKKVKRGDLAIWQNGDTWTGHIGIVLSWNKNSGKTVEGNTSSGKGSQDNGDGVYIKNRIIQPYNYFRIKWFVVVE